MCAKVDNVERVALPPRSAGRRWGLRLLYVILLVFVAVVAGHGWWGYSLQKRVDARLDLIRQAGEAVTPEELNPPPLSPAIDGGPELRAAAAVVDHNAKDWKAIMRREIALPLRSDERAAIDALLKSRVAAFDHLRAATAKPQAQLVPPIASPMLGMLEPDLTEQRTLVNFLRLAALAAHEDGDDAKAIRHVREMLYLARAVDSSPTLVAHLVSIGCAAAASSLAVELMPDLRVASADPNADPTQEKGPAGRAEVERLIVELLDEEASWQGFGRAMKGERVSQFDAVINLGVDVGMSATGRGGRGGSGGGVSPVKLYVFKPFLLANAEFMLRYMSDYTASIAMRPPTWKAFRASFPDHSAELAKNPRMLMLANILMPAMDRVAAMQYRGAGDRRVGATALACRLYQLDYDGHLPAKLGDLVPKYLPAVPRDPTAPGDKSLGYSADPSRPILYTVGENEHDDGGNEPDLSLPRSKVIETADDVKHLSRRPRPAPEPEEDPTNDQ
jgi:hypothetical protein